MLSKATVKFIKSLQVKKYRKQEQCFVVEGAKSVQELLTSDFQIEKLVATRDFLSNVRVPLKGELIEVSAKDLASFRPTTLPWPLRVLNRMFPFTLPILNMHLFWMISATRVTWAPLSAQQIGMASAK
jgi:hypothetical protein